MLGLNTSIHKQIREDVCQYMSNLDEDNKKELEENILGRDLEDVVVVVVCYLAAFGLFALLLNAIL